MPTLKERTLYAVQRFRDLQRLKDEAATIEGRVAVAERAHDEAMKMLCEDALEQEKRQFVIRDGGTDHVVRLTSGTSHGAKAYVTLESVAAEDA
jgi:hypothetical protein